MKTLKLLTAVLGASTLCLPIVLNNKIFIHYTTSEAGPTPVNSPQILNFDNCLRQALYLDYLIKNPDAQIYNITNVNNSNLNYTNSHTSLVKNSEKEESYIIYFGKTVFDNQFDIEQTFTTPQYSHSFENTVTLTVIWGISKEIKASFSHLNVNFKFSYNENQSKTQTEVITYTSPSQSIIIEPYTKCKVTTYLEISQQTVEVNLEEDIAGEVSATINDQNGNHFYQTTVGKLFQSMKQYNTLPKTISIIDDQTIHFNGLANISGITANVSNYYTAIEIIE